MILDDLITILSGICKTVIEQGSLADDEPYPAERFFTFWNDSTDDHKHYDNDTYGYTWLVDVNFYSTDPDDVYTTLDAARLALKQSGWVINGKGHTIGSDDKRYSGRGFTAAYLEIEETKRR